MSCVAQMLILCQYNNAWILLEILMQPVQGCLCMVVQFQVVACNISCVCFVFHYFKSIKRWVHNAGCISCVTVSTRTGVHDFSSGMCIKGKLFVLANYSYVRLSESNVTIYFRLSLWYGPAHRLFVVSRVFLFQFTESICVWMKMLARFLILEGRMKPVF